MRRPASIGIAAVLAAAAAFVPGIVSAQPSATCVTTIDPGQTACSVLDEDERQELEKDPNSSLLTPEDIEIADPGFRLICGEGQNGCVGSVISLEDLISTTEGTEAAELKFFTTQTDDSPVGTWSVTFEPTVLRCKTRDEPIEGGTASITIAQPKDGPPTVRGPGIDSPLFRLGYGTWAFTIPTLATGYHDVFLAMQTKASFSATSRSFVETYLLGGCTAHQNASGTRQQ